MRERERDGLKDMRIVLISKEWFAAASSTHHIQKPTKQAKKTVTKFINKSRATFSAILLLLVLINAVLVFIKQFQLGEGSWFSSLAFTFKWALIHHILWKKIATNLNARLW